MKCALPIVGLLLSGLLASAAPASKPHVQLEEEERVERIWVPLTVSGLPPGAGPMPVSCDIDLRQIAEKVQARGPIDEQSIGLILTTSRRGGIPQPVQFSPLPQPRRNPNQAQPGNEPGGAAGRLTWFATNSSNEDISYRLEFCTAPGRTVVQVPYEPRDFRVFDAEGRATVPRWFPEMQIRPQQPLERTINIFDGKQLLTTYHTGPTPRDLSSGNITFRRPFLYPVNGLEGISLTEFGKPHDPTGSHAHHYSLWVAHANVDGNDFWSERGGLILHEQFENLEDGPVFCGVIQRTTWTTTNQAILLRERRELKFYAKARNFRLIDVELEFAAAEAKPVTLGRTTFGFLAARVAQSMSVFDGGGEILNSNGERNEQGAHLKRADWLDQSGPIARGKWAGIAILDNPANPNHPTGWHCRNDGWANAAFNIDQPFTIEPGNPLRLRYRVVLHQGNALQAGVAARYQEFAATPFIRIGEPRRR